MFYFVEDRFSLPKAFVHFDRNVPGGPEWLNVLEVGHVVRLVTGLPPVGALGSLETLCTTTRTHLEKLLSPLKRT